ncbi:glutathione S-transferase family protein [Parachitinimonas caeni]|uniref:Glutathione S-transferase family protein n=1 Tax=Parachitinimonas caeni TaxID=3031301 RepID=A0ABT7DSZ5_9NEIS|nr:glutathione S-transferase family protein [Parachitinimonas caeni]MDK2123201.1 glutathione S-transferase family protein [Parachitinimonas caeni]
MLKLIIGNKNYSSWSLRPWLLLKQAQIPFEEVLIPLYEAGSRERTLAYSPTGKVPCLIDGDIVVWDSLAISEYLAECFPERQLWPAAMADRAEARAIAAEMHAGFTYLRGQMPMNLRRERPRLSKAPEVEQDIARIISIWSALRQRHAGAGDFLFGSFSVADAMYAPVVTRFKSYDVKLPALAQQYADTVLALPAMQEWYAAGRAESWRIAVSELDD